MSLLSAQIVALMTTLPMVGLKAASKAKVRRAAVAGSFYPADTQELKKEIETLMAGAAVLPTRNVVVAAVAPHAGYPFSGGVAAYTYAALKSTHYKRVVIIAPSHVEAFEFTSIYDGEGYETPLGEVAVDRDFAHRLAAAVKGAELSERGHTQTGERGEHAIEVQLPWIQEVLGDVEIVPIVMGEQSYQASRALGVGLAKLMAEEKAGETLILASSDLSHYHPYLEAQSIDSKTLDAMAQWDYFAMSRNFATRHWEACGGGAIVAAMIAAERVGASEARVQRYTNSGDVTGDKSKVVGYSSAIFVKSNKAQNAEKYSLGDDEKAELLSVARRSVEEAVATRHAFEPAKSNRQTLNHERGAFVTLTKNGRLRGCIGYTSATKPLTMTVRDTATLAALRDPRFPAVSKEELPDLRYEISVLSPLRRVQNIEEIEVGRDGLLIRNGDREGLLLPQVPVEQHWDRETFLAQTCHKAGLKPDCWKDAESDLFRFTAEVFHEKTR